MIQRIQTVYLLLIFALSCALFFLPLGGLFNKADPLEYLINFKGIYLMQSPAEQLLITNVWGLTVIVVLIPLLSLASIFLYKKRMMQIRLSFYNIVLMAGFYVLLFVYLLTASKAFEADWYVGLASAFPLVNIVLNFLAIRAIAKDEALVKSLNRLR
jgi:hypothetical protein